MSIKISPHELEVNYRLLKGGEIILPGDITQINGNHYVERTENSGMGQPFSPYNHVTTYRKIKTENSTQPNIIFFNYQNPQLPFWASTKNWGHLFYSDGASHSGAVSGWCISALKGYPEIPQKEAFNMLKSKDAKRKVAKILGIELYLDIPITDQQKEAIINKLQKSRAFNEDSAMEMKEIEICEQLAENKVIQSYENRFYL